MCGHLTGASTSSDPCKPLHIEQNLQRAQTCTIARSCCSEGQGCLTTFFCSFSFYFFMHCNFRGGFPMRFSLFPRLFQCIFCIQVPNMASLSGPILYFHHSDVQRGYWSYFMSFLSLYFKALKYTVKASKKVEIINWKKEKV